MINKAGFELIKYFEGLCLTAYKDKAGVWTIGYGHTDRVWEGQSITAKQADVLLRSDVEIASKAVNLLVTVPLNANQYAALVSFTFNLGADRLKKSTLLKLLNKRKYSEAADQFPRWIYCGGIILRGLKKRREAERSLFLTTTKEKSK